MPQWPRAMAAALRCAGKPAASRSQIRVRTRRATGESSTTHRPATVAGGPRRCRTGRRTSSPSVLYHGFVALPLVIPAKRAERARAGIHLLSKPLDSRGSLPSSEAIGGGNDDQKYSATFLIHDTRSTADAPRRGACRLQNAGRSTSATSVY